MAQAQGRLLPSGTGAQTISAASSQNAVRSKTGRVSYNSRCKAYRRPRRPLAA